MTWRIILYIKSNKDLGLGKISLSVMGRVYEKACCVESFLICLLLFITMGFWFDFEQHSADTWEKPSCGQH